VDNSNRLYNNNNNNTSRRRRNKTVSEFVTNTSNFALDNKIREACAGLKPSVQWTLKELPRDEDKELIADYILNWSNESEYGMPMTQNTKKGYIQALVYLARYHKHKKSFKEMTKEDILDGYLRSLKKTYEQDPEQKWMSTYNTRAQKYLPFWKWLTQSDLPREERQTPPQLKGLRHITRKHKTNTKREHFWTPEEHKVFLERCEDLRLACYHAIALETGGRPGELLELKISDLKIITSSSTGKKYAEFWIGRTSKMKEGRPVSIAEAIPYFNEWVHVHPMRDSPQGAYLFPSQTNRAKYRNLPLQEESLRQRYADVIENQFPKLLDRPEISLEEKATLRSLIYDKPHHPYLRRHENGTDLFYKVPLPAWKQHMGHSKNSRMYEVYTHELGTEGNQELLIAKGIITRGETMTKTQVEMQPIQCPLCHEVNKANSDFCFGCNYIISKKGVLETKEKDEAAAREKEENKRKLEQVMQSQLQQAEAISQMRGLLNQARESLLTMPPYEEGTQRMAKVLIKDRLHFEDKIKKKDTKAEKAE
jgi:integrase